MPADRDRAPDVHEGLLDFIEHADDAVIRTDESLRLTYANEHARRLFGDEVKAATPDRTHHAVPLPATLRVALGRTIEERGRRTACVGWPRPDGVRTIEWRLVPMRDLITGEWAVTGIGRDVTDVIATTQYLVNSAASYRALVEAGAQFVWRSTRNGGTSDATDVSGFFADDPGNRSDAAVWFAAVHPGDRERVRSRWRAAIEMGVPFDEIHRVRRRDGEWRTMRARAVPARNPDGIVREWIGALTDITDDHVELETLRQLESRYRRVVESLGVGVDIERAQADPPEPTDSLGAETVLLVEDEAGVRAVARRILTRHGYRVLEAADGRDALRVWRERAAMIDVLLSDIRMPELSGRELAAALRADDPRLPVVLMSGHASPDVLAQLADDHCFVPKPFSAPALLGALRRALGDDSTNG
jgi:PAS domain S-box-containing protein